MYRIHSVWVFGLLTLFASASLGLSQEPPAVPNNDVSLQSGVEVQLRGPMHEAYAQPAGVQPEPGVVIGKAPSPLIPEEPPAQKPEAANVQWIPGYWAWDAEKADFLWVSGVYRVPPQDRTFVPGYWQHTDDGWRWIAGFWSDARQQETPYTPEPPAPLDTAGPSMPAPNDDAVYIPGSWVYRDSRFLWHPGYYAALQVGRVWVPAHYLWTPNGYLFVNGYWDYPLENRGLAFAPVSFSRPLWNDPNWQYQPNYVINPNAFYDSAFVGPGGFYFGDYYNPLCARAGYRPWYDGRGRYDPLFAYHGVRDHHGDRNWTNGVARLYGDRMNGRAARPPITLAQQTSLVNGRGTNAFGMPMVTPASQLQSKQGNIVRATPAQLQTQRNFAQGTRQMAQNRSKLDSASVGRNHSGQSLRTGGLGSSNFAVHSGNQGSIARSSTVQSSPTPRVAMPYGQPRGVQQTHGTPTQATQRLTTASHTTPTHAAQRVSTPSYTTPTHTTPMHTAPTHTTQMHATPTHTVPRNVTPSHPTQYRAAAPTHTPQVNHAAPQVHRAAAQPARTTNHAPARGAAHTSRGHR